MDCKPYHPRTGAELLDSLAALIRIPTVEGAPAPGAPFGRRGRALPARDARAV